jgi:hypothetical protein
MAETKLILFEPLLLKLKYECKLKTDSERITFTDLLAQKKSSLNGMTFHIATLFGPVETAFLIDGIFAINTPSNTKIPPRI